MLPFFIFRTSDNTLDYIDARMFENEDEDEDDDEEFFEDDEK